jgi:hypothetical protein
MFRATDSLRIWRAAREVLRAAAKPLSTTDDEPRIHHLDVMRHGRRETRAVLGRVSSGIFIGPNDSGGTEEFWVPEDMASRFEDAIADYLYAAAIKEEAIDALLNAGIRPSE